MFPTLGITVDFHVSSILDLQRAGLVTWVALNAAQQLISVVGKDRQVITHTGYHDMGQSLARQLPFCGMHDTDAPIGSHALRLMHVDGVGKAKPGKHGVSAKSDDIVITSIHGELTVKRLRQSADVWLLVPENTNFPAIPLDDSGCEIWGVVTHSIRRHCGR